ncbi:MAG: PLDc_N domain-containing protein [Candidatus Hydrogenedentes bacterium]|nr:PLDc_N domain-containing protein [Candidatus Hydrogenedentota bacterium]
MDGDLVAPLFVLMFFAVSICATILWIWMIIDCAMNEPSEGNDKIVWILVIVLTGWVGALIYFFFRRPKRMALYSARFR